VRSEASIRKLYERAASSNTPRLRVPQSVTNSYRGISHVHGVMRQIQPTRVNHRINAGATTSGR